jgi:chromosome segregation ATPase
MVLDELRARLERLLASQGRSNAGLRDALIELKVAASQSREALAVAERELASQQQQLADAERRGRLATEIGDQETARIANEFAAKHRERIDLLTRKVAVIRDELAFVEREYAAVAAEYRHPGSPVAAPRPAEPEDRELLDLETRADREAIERAVQAQLESLKRKLGKN